MLSERSKIVKGKRMGSEIFRQLSCKGHSVVSHLFPHPPCLRSKEKFGQKKGEFEDWNRTFVQMVMNRVPLEEVDESDNAADEKIWQSFENLKEVVNNIKFPVVLLEGYMKKVHCVEFSEADSPTFKNSPARRIEASLFYTLEALNYILANNTRIFTSEDGGPLPLSHLTR